MALKQRLLDLQKSCQRIYRVVNDGLGKNFTLEDLRKLAERVAKEILKFKVDERELSGPDWEKFQQLDPKLASDVSYFSRNHDERWAQILLSKVDPERSASGDLGGARYELELVMRTTGKFIEDLGKLAGRL